jgi:hypothetical protein
LAMDICEDIKLDFNFYTHLFERVQKESDVLTPAHWQRLSQMKCLRCSN